MTHELKCVNPAFQAKWDGNKNWEYRKDDRNYQENDILVEKEYDPTNNIYSGRAIEERVVWMIKGGVFGIPEGYVIMSTKLIRHVFHAKDESKSS